MNYMDERVTKVGDVLTFTEAYNSLKRCSDTMLSAGIGIKESSTMKVPTTYPEVNKEIRHVFSMGVPFAIKTLWTLKNVCDTLLKRAHGIRDEKRDNDDPLTNGFISKRSMSKSLWFDDLDKHLAFMNGIYNKLVAQGNEPKWLTQEDIARYTRELKLNRRGGSRIDFLIPEFHAWLEKNDKFLKRCLDTFSDDRMYDIIDAFEESLGIKFIQKDYKALYKEVERLIPKWFGEEA